MKMKITVEEVISQQFEVEVSSKENAYNEICKKYKDGNIVVDNPWLNQAVVMIDGEWMDLHV